MLDLDYRGGEMREFSSGSGWYWRRGLSGSVDVQVSRSRGLFRKPRTDEEMIELLAQKVDEYIDARQRQREWAHERQQELSERAQILREVG